MASTYVDLSGLGTDYINPVRTSDDFEYANFYGTLASGAKHKFTDSELRKVHNMFTMWGNNGIYDGQVMDNFNRWYTIFPDMEMSQDLKSYIFITRPELNITGSGTGNISQDNISDPRLQYLAAMNPEIMHMLTTGFSGVHDFIPYLQGRAESMQLPDYQIRSLDFTIPFYSYKFAYPTVTNESITGGNFEITFREDEDLRVSKLFQFWIYYMDAVMKNKMKPLRQNILDNYYDFMCSVYEFVCAPDAQRILFWAKYTGCFPTSVPLSTFSHNLRSDVENKIGINFQYVMVEAFDPKVLEDFNQNTKFASGYAAPIYNEDHGMIGDTLVSCPKVIMTSDQRGLLLKWLPVNTSGIAGSINKVTPVLRNIATGYSNAALYALQNTPLAGGKGSSNSPAINSLSSKLQSSSDRLYE